MKQNKMFLGLTKRFFDAVVFRQIYDLEMVYGAEKLPGDGAAVVATNHSYWVDPFVAGYLLFSKYPERPFSLPGKDSLFRYPVSRQAMEMWGAYPVDRRGSTGMTNRRLVKAFRECMEHEFPFIYCPEGTRDPEHITEIYPGFILRAWEKSPEIPLLVESQRYVPGKTVRHRGMEVFIDGPFYPADLGLNSSAGRGLERMICEENADRVSDFVGNLFSERTGLPYVPEYKTKITEMRAAGGAYSARVKS